MVVTTGPSMSREGLSEQSSWSSSGSMTWAWLTTRSWQECCYTYNKTVGESGKINTSNISLGKQSFGEAEFSALHGHHVWSKFYAPVFPNTETPLDRLSPGHRCGDRQEPTITTREPDDDHGVIPTAVIT
ncbi:hypothetical protein PoB_001683200 [Plakobranchus ocellatus]|uniref:Uncharacterized protein n=1 Tax=Plakobranchus ocellatus TaxID=259542 RepID=A0AAV3Z736_9GAST|nr:hypothetical protein PoB_001683200 [Plakobranchus ocellatus]